MQLNSIQRVHYSEFPLLDLQYPFLNGIYNQLYKFFYVDGYSQKSEYSLTVQREEAASLQDISLENSENPEDAIKIHQYFKQTLAEEYAKFGIQVEGAKPILTKRNYILFLTEEDMESEELDSVIQQKAAEIGAIEFTHVIFCYDVCNEVGMDQVRQLNLLYPKLTVVNNLMQQNYNVKASDNETLKKAQAKDITNLFESLNFHEQDINKIYSAVSKIYDQVKALDEFTIITNASGHKSKVPALYYIDPTETDWSPQKRQRVYLVYYSMAALINRTCRKFLYVPDYSNAYYLNNVAKLSSRKYIYLDDYLANIVEPVEVGVRLTNGVPYVFVLDYNELNEKLKADPAYCMPELTMSMVAVDLESCAILEDKLEQQILKYSQISVLNIAQQFGMDSEDHVTAIKGFNKLQLLITEFEYLLQRETGQVWKTPVDCSNLLLFTLGQKTYLAHVSNINSNTIPYLVTPTVKSYTAFPMRLSHEDIAALYDMSIFYECDYIIRGYTDPRQLGLLPGNKVHHNVPKGAKGILLTDIACKPYPVTSECGFTFEEIGLWVETAAQFRQGGGALLVNNVPLQSLRALRGLTYYGGCHPCISTSYTLQPNAMGGLLNARKILGGYIDV